MKKCISYAAAVFFLCTSIVYAVPMEFTITDKYIGGNYAIDYATHDGLPDGDVIAYGDDVHIFNIDSMKVSIETSGEINVTIQTGYYEEAGTNINYGDLFISTYGWSPVGDPEGYETDNYLEEGTTTWDYVLDTSSGLNETGNIYNVNSDYIRSSNDEMEPHYSNSNWYRTEQAVLYDTNGGGKVEGEKAGFDFSHDLSNNSISYGFNLSALGINWENGLDLGFHWAMTCANDVIEGSVSMSPVPEPGTMLLLGFGLLGLGAVGRKHYPQK